MEVFWFWFLILLLVFAVVAAPWGYTRDRWPYRYGGTYRYYPSLGAVFGVILILLLFWTGLIVITSPWILPTAPPPAPVE